MYVYIESEHHAEGSLWTVGFYSPDGKWNPESDHNSKENAAKRVHYLNGGNISKEAQFFTYPKLDQVVGKTIDGVFIPSVEDYK